MELDSVLKKLRKLKRLYEGAKAINSESEAATAAALIQKLLTEYNLSIDEVGVNEEKKGSGIEETFCSGHNYPYIEGRWELQLWHVLCKYNFCKCFVYGSSYHRLVLFGKSENLEMVKWLHDTLAERYVEFSRQRYHEYKKTEEYAMTFKKPTIGKFQRSYLMGAVNGLDKKLGEMVESDKKADQEYGTKVTALVLRTNTAIDEFIQDKYGGTGKGRKYTNHTISSAYGSGVKDGYNTDIHKPIQNNQRAAAQSVGLLG